PPAAAGTRPRRWRCRSGWPTRRHARCRRAAGAFPTAPGRSCSCRSRFPPVPARSGWEKAHGRCRNATWPGIRDWASDGLSSGEYASNGVGWSGTMPGYSTRMLAMQVAGDAWRLRVLSDSQQFHDPDGHGDALGISSAQWSLFGQLWPAGQLLAQAMHGFDIAGKNILELGCGIGLASLVLQRRGARITASDVHPLAEPFLAYNAALNELEAVTYRQL